MIHKMEKEAFAEHDYTVDVCVVGGGLAGMFAAISAARHHSRVLLMQDRPVLGGNASSEIRMWIRGAHGENNRETGLLEELSLENVYRNPTMNFSLWDSVLYEKVRFQENLELLLNCSCCDAIVENQHIQSVRGWQTTTQSWHNVTAKIFIDCSGDSVLAPLTGAEFRMGRESATEFDEDIAPAQSDEKTMGMSCLFQVRQTDHPVPFVAPAWAHKYTKEDFTNKINFSTPTKWTTDNYWWMEIGGVYDSIGDTEKLRDELLKIALGSWDFIKNGGVLDAENWELDWMGFLPGKRESRRYVGDYIMTQKDVRAQGHFEDLIAYGGWTMDDHHPQGFKTTEPPTIWHPAPSPYGIPYRCLYSKNIDNLMFAGRNISVTHTALSSCRVMATCGLLGQAAGTAAALAVAEGFLPRALYPDKIEQLQQQLLFDDCYLPFHPKANALLASHAVVQATAGDAALLTDGWQRKIDADDHAWVGKVGDEITITFPRAEAVQSLRIVFDSDLNRECWKDHLWFVRDFVMKCNTFANQKSLTIPSTLVKAYSVYVDHGDGGWQLWQRESNNYQRVADVTIAQTVKRIKLVPQETWGCDTVRIYSLDYAAQTAADRQ